MGSQRAGGLHPDAGRDAGHQDALAAQIDAGEHVVGRRGRAEFLLS
jgi:hypothetical protein